MFDHTYSEIVQKDDRFVIHCKLAAPYATPLGIFRWQKGRSSSLDLHQLGFVFDFSIISSTGMHHESRIRQCQVIYKQRANEGRDSFQKPSPKTTALQLLMDEGRDHMEIWLGAECYVSEYQARGVRSDARS